MSEEKHNPAKPREDVFSLPGVGVEVRVRYPDVMSEADISDVEDWVRLLLRKMRREAAAPEPKGESC